MSGLNVSIIFFFSVVTLCEFARRFFKRIFPSKVYFCFAGELASSFQICACYLELKMLREIGPWGGGFGPDVSLTLLFVIFLAHGASFDGTAANPVASLQEFLALDCSFVGSIVKILAQFLGMEAACVFTKKYWSKEFTHFHMIQNLMAQDCSSSLNTSISQGIFVEGMGSFLFQLIILKLHTCSPMYRVPIVALSITALTYTGMLLALFVYQGNIPRFFQTNLLYSQKKKYRIFKGKVTSNSVVEERQTKTEKKNSSSGLIN
ncbi:aquaporin-12-like isoform X2 [Pantherophis guttatus]|uniref:Aquaporin-12-like isoform X2 n=1 Tax=Pantherophis guttatus TaxID=94885 RepID=A0A6P9DWK2_PANGU|nr:aquaporin-12-like isoform X2 [Pantherophis guttatus]